MPEIEKLKEGNTDRLKLDNVSNHGCSHCVTKLTTVYIGYTTDCRPAWNKCRLDRCLQGIPEEEEEEEIYLAQNQQIKCKSKSYTI